MRVKSKGNARVWLISPVLASASPLSTWLRRWRSGEKTSHTSFSAWARSIDSEIYSKREPRILSLSPSLFLFFAVFLRHWISSHFLKCELRWCFSARKEPGILYQCIEMVCATNIKYNKHHAVAQLIAKRVIQCEMQCRYVVGCIARNQHRTKETWSSKQQFVSVRAVSQLSDTVSKRRSWYSQNISFATSVRSIFVQLNSRQSEHLPSGIHIFQRHFDEMCKTRLKIKIKA